MQAFSKDMIFYDSLFQFLHILTNFKLQITTLVVSDAKMLKYTWPPETILCQIKSQIQYALCIFCFLFKIQ